MCLILPARMCWRSSICSTLAIPSPSTSVPVAGRPDTAEKIRGALEKSGIEFIDENGGGPGVRLRKRQRLKKPK
jgi:hypothetical protein